MATKSITDLARKFDEGNPNALQADAPKGIWDSLGTLARRIWSRGTRNGNGVRSSDFPVNNLTDQQLDAIADLVAKRRADFVEQADEMAEDAKNVQRPAGAPKQTGKEGGGTTADIRTAQENIVRTRLGAVFSSSKTYFGLAVTGMLIYAGIIIDNTDGQKVTITKMVIDDDNNFAIIDYTAGNKLFQPAEKDTITLANTGLESANDCVIVEILAKRRIKVDISRIPQASKPSANTIIINGTSPGGVGGATPEFTCNSDFGNQFGGALDDLLGAVGSAVGSALNSAINAAGAVIAGAISPIATAAAAAAGAAGGAARAGFCAMVPIFCDSTIWIIIGMLIAAVFAFIIFMK